MILSTMELHKRKKFALFYWNAHNLLTSNGLQTLIEFMTMLTKNDTLFWNAKSCNDWQNLMKAWWWNEMQYLVVKYSSLKWTLCTVYDKFVLFWMIFFSLKTCSFEYNWCWKIFDMLLILDQKISISLSSHYFFVSIKYQHVQFANQRYHSMQQTYEYQKWKKIVSSLIFLNGLIRKFNQIVWPRLMAIDMK